MGKKRTLKNKNVAPWDRNLAGTARSFSIEKGGRRLKVEKIKTVSPEHEEPM